MSYFFATLPQEFLFQYALSLSLTELYQLCQTNQRLNQLICNNDFFGIKNLLKTISLLII